MALIEVPQLAKASRMPPQRPNGAATYCSYVQVCAIHSLASQMMPPTTEEAP